MEGSNLTMSDDDQKILLLHTVSRKVIEMTGELPGLEVLDFNISKTAKRVTLSIGYKEAKPVKKFDLSELLEFKNVAPAQQMTNSQGFQPNMECEIHGQNCPFSKHPNKEDLEAEKPKHKIPLSERPEFNGGFPAPGLDKMQQEIVRILTDFHQRESDTRQTESAADNKTPKWFDTNVDTEVAQLDETYFQYLLKERAANPSNPKIQMKIDNFIAVNSKEDDKMPEDDFEEFVPGKKWLSKQERRQKDLGTALDGLKTAISTHKTNAWQLVFDVLHQALAYEEEGKLLTTEIKKALEAEEMDEPRGTKERRQQIQERRQQFQERRQQFPERRQQLQEGANNLKPTFATEDNVDEDSKRNLEKVFKQMDKIIRDRKQEDDLKNEALCTGSYGSSLFHV